VNALRSPEFIPVTLCFLLKTLAKKIKWLDAMAPKNIANADVHSFI
jgi:hypothetical protein